jgi:hypothetical protein
LELPLPLFLSLLLCFLDRSFEGEEGSFEEEGSFGAELANLSTFADDECLDEDPDFSWRRMRSVSREQGVEEEGGYQGENR